MLRIPGWFVKPTYAYGLGRWHEYFDPPLPCATLPSLYTQTPFPYTFAEDNPFLAEIDVAKAAKAARKLLTLQNRQQHEVDDEFEQTRRYWWRRGSGETHSPRGEAENGDGKKTPQTSAPSGAFANLVSQLVEKAREEKARMSNGSNHVEKQELGMKVLATPPPLREGSDATVGGEFTNRLIVYIRLCRGLTIICCRIILKCCGDKRKRAVQCIKVQWPIGCSFNRAERWRKLQARSNNR